MINIVLNGACGHMGRVIAGMVAEQEDCRIVAGVDLQKSEKEDFPVVQHPSEISQPVDVIIDFSHPSALKNILDYAVSRKIPIVVATTGLSQEQRDSLQTAAKEIPVFFSANMSLGIHLLIDLVKKASAVLGEEFDIEIVERHHNQKIDAPSGTALAIADALSEVVPHDYVYDRHAQRKKRTKGEIGIHAVRGGTIVGDHTVIFAGKDEVIEVKHAAASKEVFATGSIRAARFLCGKPAGMYCMSDLM